jgi:hypothetical protein
VAEQVDFDGDGVAVAGPEVLYRRVAPRLTERLVRREQ